MATKKRPVKHVRIIYNWDSIKDNTGQWNKKNFCFVINFYTFWCAIVEAERINLEFSYYGAISLLNACIDVIVKWILVDNRDNNTLQ